MVVEGMNALPAAMKLSRLYEVELPIIEAVNQIVNEGASPSEIVLKLMQRVKKNELSHQAVDYDIDM
jgi:glycerol-3-phosphate dehydrogenase